MKTAKAEPAAITALSIGRRILSIRDQKVLLDVDLAQLYGVTTSALIQAVKRNPERFPDDFMRQLTSDEFAALRSQSVISKSYARGGRRSAPYVFTEQGVAMLSSVLRSPRAIAVNIEIMRAFVRLREVLGTNRKLAMKLDALEKKIGTHDRAITGLVTAIRQLVAVPVKPRRGIGFIIDDA